MISTLLADLPDDNNDNNNIIANNSSVASSKYKDNKSIKQNANNSLVLSTQQKQLPESKDELYCIYIQETRMGLENLKVKEYSKAQGNYLTCHEVAKKLKDEPKAIDSLCNYSTCQYFNGQFFKCLSSLQLAYKSYSQLSQIALQPLPKIHLGIKLHINMLNAHLINANGNEAVSQMDSIISLIQKESKVKKQHSLLKNVIFNLFRIETLLTDNICLDSSDNDNDHLKIIYNILKGFHAFLKEENYGDLTNVFKEAADNYQELKDSNGYYFAIFYQYATKAILGGDDMDQLNDVKNKISLCNKYLIGNDSSIKEKNIDLVLKEFETKLVASVEIYKKLLALEEDIIEKVNEENYGNDNNPANLNKSALSKSIDKSHLFTNDRISSPIFIKLLLRFSLNYIDNENDGDNEEMNKAMHDEITAVIDKIDKGEIDISKVKLALLDQDISNSLKLLFDNIIFIYYKQKLRNSFLMYRSQTQKGKRNSLGQVCNKYLEENFQIIRTITKLTKVNYTSKGTKSHYYKVDTLSECFQIRNKSSDKTPSASLSLREEVVKITYGISTSNVKKKLVNANLPQSLNDTPWRFLSICTRDRSIDLYFEEEQLENWFYGLSYYLTSIDVPFKIISCNKFIFTKSKWKIIHKLKDALQENRIKSDTDKALVKSLSTEKGIQNFSFLKLFLLYSKIFNLAKSRIDPMIVEEDDNDN